MNVPAIFGVLHLTWIGRAALQPRLRKVSLGEEELTTEAKIAAALRRLPQAVVQQLIGQLPLAKRHKLRVVKPRRKPHTVRSLKKVPRPKHGPKVVWRADSAKVKLDARRRQLLCHAFGGNVPGVDICH